MRYGQIPGLDTPVSRFVLGTTSLDAAAISLTRAQQRWLNLEAENL